MKYQKSQYFGMKLEEISKKVHGVLFALMNTTRFHTEMLRFVENILEMRKKT